MGCLGLCGGEWSHLAHFSALVAAFGPVGVQPTYYPQSNNQTKQVNQILKPYPCCYIECCGWLGLPACQFACNSSVCSSKQQTSLYKQYGFQSQDHRAVLGQLSRSFSLRDLVWWLQHIGLLPSEQLEKAQAVYKGYEDRHMQPALDFGAGYYVCLSHGVVQSILLVGWTTVTWAHIELWTNFHQQLPCVCRTHTVVCISLLKPVNINTFSSTTSNDGSQSEFHVWTVLDSIVLQASLQDFFDCAGYEHSGNCM